MSEGTLRRRSSFGNVFAATVVRTKECGLVGQEHGKSNASNRVISVPIEALELLRRGERSTEYVFPSSIGWAPWGSNPRPAE